MKLNTAWMTKPINSLDSMGWGRTGAAAGAALGGTYGMFSDDSSMLGGAFKGAIGGFGMGKLARFGSKSFRDNAQMQTYKDKSMFKDFSLMSTIGEINTMASNYNSFKATATSATP